jgi:hypothetical protein
MTRGEQMQDVSRTQQASVIVFERSPERGVLLCDKFFDRGIEASFVDSLEGLFQSLQERDYHILFLGDVFSETNELLNFCQGLCNDFPRRPAIIIHSDNPQINSHDCHNAGVTALTRKNTDFVEICDLFERLAQVAGKRLYDGTQIRLTNKLGKISGQITNKSGAHEIEMSVNEIGRGGFYYEFDKKDASQLKEGTVLHFKMTLSMFPSYSFTGKGFVSWTRPLEGGRLGVGIEFVSIPFESENLILAFVDLFKVREFVPTKKVS